MPGNMRSTIRPRRAAGVTFLITLLMACTSAPTTPVTLTPTGIPIPLEGTAWVLISLGGGKPIAGTTITLAFDKGILRGSAGCNTYGGGPDSGPYRATSDGTLTISQIAITLMACIGPQGIMEQESRYMQMLQQAATVRIADDRLEIRDESGELILVYERAR